MKSRSGTDRILMDVYFVPNYRGGDEAAYLEVRDQPLRVRILSREYGNRLNPDGPVDQECR